MITYHKEKLSAIREELEPILIEHYKELAMYKHKMPLNPDWETYLNLDKTDVLKIATVRDDGKLVGYFLSVVVPDLHYRNDKTCINDILLLKKEYRTQGVGEKLFRYVEKWMKDLGVSVIKVHMKTFLPFDPLCEKLEYDYAERVYTKYIGE